VTVGIVSALQAALAAEDAAIFGYGVAGAHLTGSSQASAERDWTGHSQARDALAAMIARRGAAPGAAQAFYQLPFRVHDAASAMALAARLEDGVTRAYLGLVAVSDRQLRHFGAMAMQGAARRAAFWRGSTQAFPGLSLLAGQLAAARRTSRGVRSLVAEKGGQDPHDRAGGLVNVVGDGDPFRPRPPEPPHAILAAAGVDVLLKRPRGRVDHVQAGPAPRRRHQPRLKPAMGQFVG